jgi:hypothetical protein
MLENRKDLSLVSKLTIVLGVGAVTAGGYWDVPLTTPRTSSKPGVKKSNRLFERNITRPVENDRMNGREGLLPGLVYNNTVQA